MQTGAVASIKIMDSIKRITSDFLPLEEVLIVIGTVEPAGAFATMPLTAAQEIIRAVVGAIIPL